jgi:hypothetical protein
LRIDTTSADAITYNNRIYIADSQQITGIPVNVFTHLLVKDAGRRHGQRHDGRGDLHAASLKASTYLLVTSVEVR